MPNINTVAVDRNNPALFTSCPVESTTAVIQPNRFVTTGATVPGSDALGIKQNATAGASCLGVAVLCSGQKLDASNVVVSPGVIYDQVFIPLTAGEAVVEAGAAITIGASVSSNASGQAITATTGHKILGTALQAASGAAALIRVRLNPADTAA